MPAPGVTAELVRALYEVHLGRPPESEAAVAGHMARHPDALGLIRAIAGSDEARERARLRAAVEEMEGWRRLSPFPPGARRILLFGAYGNGNLGDAVQAEAVAALLHEAMRVPVHLRATSWIDHCPGYPFDPGSRCPAGTIASPAALAQHDMLLIGGGGLFGAVHYPLLDPGWIAMLGKLGLPYGLVGIGAASTLPREPQVAPAWQAMQAGAVFRSGRDLASLSAMPGAHWLADPVLVAGLRAGRGLPRPPRPGARPLCIVKQPNGAAEARFLDQVAALGPECDVVAIEPRHDAGLAARWPGLRLVTDWAALETLCAEASVVVSARYHGCIAGLLAGVPCFGAGAGKAWVLFDTLGRPERFLGADADLAARVADPPPPFGPEVYAPLLAAAEAALGDLAGCIEALPVRR